MDFLSILVIVAFAGIFFYAWYFSEEQKAKRVFTSTQKKPIGQCKDNDINRIEGQLQLVSQPLKAPLSDRLCALFKVRVERKEKAGNSTRWREIIEHNCNTHFLLSDGEYYAFIDTDMAQLLLEKDAHYTSGLGEDASDKLEAFLSAFDEKSTTLFGLMNHSLRYFEGVLEEGETVAVCGRGNWQNVEKYAELAFLKEKGVDRVFVFSDDEHVPLHISDDIDILALK